LVLSILLPYLILSAWNSRDLEWLLAVVGYILVLSVVGIRWFQWEVR